MIALLLICAAIALLNAAGLLEMEFGSGSLTGILVRCCLAGAALFAAGAGLTPRWPGLASALAVLAITACLPFYAYRVAPGPLSRLSAAPSSVAAPAGLVFDDLAVAGLLSVASLGVLIVWRGGRNRRKSY